MDNEGVSELGVEIARPEEGRDILRDGRCEFESLEEKVALGREGSKEVITVAEQAISPELEVEGGRNRLKEEERALEMGLGMVDIVRVTEQKSRDTEASLDFNKGKERDLALADGFQALYGFPHLTQLLMVIR